MKYLKDFDFKNKRVFLRADFNVPVENGAVKDDFRIRETLPTIEYILKQPKSKIVIASHLGRPKGKKNPEFTLKPVAARLSELIKKDVKFIKDILSPDADKAIRNLESGEIAMMENVRFWPEEEADDEKFAVNLVHHFGVYVNEAFAVDHRVGASLTQIPRFKPSCAGFLLEREIKELGRALSPPKRPAIAVIGGAKIETKIPVIENLAKNYDAVLVGGKVAVEAKEKMTKFPANVVLPDDFVEGNFDIGPKTAEKYAQAVSAAGFVVWNGSMGKFEEKEYAAGTDALYEAICGADAHRIAGGGETIEYINAKDGGKCFDFVSSGGGAMLEFLAGKKLPGIEALENSQ